jgi:hypothetical protein
MRKMYIEQSRTCLWSIVLASSTGLYLTFAGIFPERPFAVVERDPSSSGRRPAQRIAVQSIKVLVLHVDQLNVRPQICSAQYEKQAILNLMTALNSEGLHLPVALMTRSMPLSRSTSHLLPRQPAPPRCQPTRWCWLCR